MKCAIVMVCIQCGSQEFEWEIGTGHIHICCDCGEVYTKVEHMDWVRFPLEA